MPAKVFKPSGISAEAGHNRLEGLRRGMMTSNAQVTNRPRRRRLHAALALLALLPGCSTVNGLKASLFGGGPAPGQPGHIAGFLGGVAADEPRAAIAGREVLASGGNAADAAVAVALTLAVTLPSRAGIGGGGACLAYMPDRKSPNAGVPEAVMFVPKAPAPGGARGDRPAAVPMLARGLYLLNARYGSQPFEMRLAAAEQLARFGFTVSKALAQDLRVVAGPLFADPQAQAIFGAAGAPLAEGQELREPGLAATLAQLRFAGVGGMYNGTLARRIVQASDTIGGPLTLADLRDGLPTLAPPLFRDNHSDRIAFLPPPADGGLAAEAAFDSLVANPDDVTAATRRALAVAARWRAGGISPDAALAARDLTEPAASTFPASTSFVTLDRHGGAVACTLTMNNLFGTGRVLPGLGFVAAASPAAVPPPLLSAALVWNDNLKAFRAAVAASGQAAAPVSVAVGLQSTLRSGRPMSVLPPDPGRENIAACARYLPGDKDTCGWATDPRGAGLALGGN